MKYSGQEERRTIIGWVGVQWLIAYSGATSCCCCRVLWH